jgi:hypothetical protein
LVSGRYLAPSFGYAKTRPMAQDKKSFIAYSDWKETFDVLPDDKAGQLIKHIFAYVNDEDPKTDDVLINAVFANIKNSLKRDLKKWKKQHQQRIDAGKRSAEIRKQNSTKVNERSTTDNDSSISSTDSVSVSVTVNDTVNVTDNKKKSIEERKNDFWQNLSSSFIDQYEVNLLKDFFDYWTEASPGARKMRFEKEKAFDVSRRLKTWLKNESKFGNKMDHDNKASDAVNWFNS